MKHIIDFIAENKELLFSLLLTLYELIIRIWPTTKSYSLLTFLVKLIPDRRKTLMILFVLASFCSYSQNWGSFRGVFLNGYQGASLSPTPPTGYGAITFFDDSTGIYAYDTAWYNLRSTSIDYGLSTRIPYMNLTNNGFLYNSRLTFNGSILEVNNGATSVQNNGQNVIWNTGASNHFITNAGVWQSATLDFVIDPNTQISTRDKLIIGTGASTYSLDVQAFSNNTPMFRVGRPSNDGMTIDQSGGDYTTIITGGTGSSTNLTLTGSTDIMLLNAGNTQVQLSAASDELYLQANLLNELYTTPGLGTAQISYSGGSLAGEYTISLNNAALTKSVQIDMDVDLNYVVLSQGTASPLEVRLEAGELYFTNLRTTCVGAPTGAIANVAGTLTVCP